jgi:hypothetical protein
MSVTRTFVIGMGEVGRRIASALTAAGVHAVPVTRGAGWDEALADREAPLIVSVREEALADVLVRVRGVAHSRLVFVQNGWIRPLLGELPGCTRGLVWFTSKGEFFKVLRPSVFYGPLADDLAGALQRGGVAAVALDEGAFAGAEAEKMGFNCVVGLPLAVHRLALAEYLERHREEAQAVFSEAVGVTARALGAKASPEWWPAFLQAVGPLGWVKAATAKALEYRNGTVVHLARELGLAAPVNERLLAAAGWSL